MEKLKMNFKNIIADFIKDEEGLTAVEYAIAGSLVGLAVVGSFTALGGAVGGAIDEMTGVIGGDAGGAAGG
jgi:pilus assembly protein Flp/PilA